VGKTAAELREEIELQRNEVGRDLDAIGERVSPGRIMERKTESVKQRFRGVKDSVKDSVMGTAEEASDLAQSTRDNVAGVPEKVRSTTQGNPLAVGLVAFGFGLIAASLIPPSKKEQELGQQLQPQLEDAARRATEAGRDFVGELKPEVANAVEEVKGQATEAAQRLGDQAKQGAEHTAERAKEAARS